MPPSFVPDNIYYSGQTFSRLQELSETKRESPELQLPNSSQFSAFHKRNEKGRGHVSDVRTSHKRNPEQLDKTPGSDCGKQRFVSVKIISKYTDKNIDVPILM